MTSLEEGKWLIFPTNDLKHNRHLRGQKNYDIGEYDDDDDDDDINMMMLMMTMMIKMCFLYPKGPQIGLAPGVADKLLMMIMMKLVMMTMMMTMMMMLMMIVMVMIFFLQKHILVAI